MHSPSCARLLRVPRVLCLVLGLLACGGERTGPDAPRHAAPGATSTGGSRACPRSTEAPFPLPRTSEEDRSLETWLSSGGPELDEVLLTPSEIDHQNAALTGGGEDLPFARRSLAVPPPVDLLMRAMRERLAFLRERFVSGAYVDAQGARLGAALLARLDPPPSIDLEPDLRIALERIPLRCGPMREPFYSAPAPGDDVDVAFDRNACSTIERQEPVQVLAQGDDGMLLVRTRYTFGWIGADAPLSPSVPPSETAVWTDAPRMRSRARLTLRAEDGAAIEVDPDVLLPADPQEPFRVRFASAAGLHRSVALEPGLLDSTRRPLTRRAFLTEAFRHLDRPYGWGGRDGGLDCSELVMNVFATFGLEMPRHSARQAEAGSFSIPVPPETTEGDRLRLIDAAARRGVVLLHFPGHIMIWLGRNRQGEARVLHAFAEYLEPCEAGGETLRRVNRVSVSDLELGRGTSRRAFIERIDRIVVIGRDPGPELRGSIVWRPAIPVDVPATGACNDDLRTRVFTSPALPHPGQPLRFVVTSSTDPGPVDLALRDPRGRLVRPPVVHRLGGPPFSLWVEIPHPAPGRWTIALGEGERILACDRVTVVRHPRDVADPVPFEVGGADPEGPRRRVDPHEAFWFPRWSWEEDTENFYAAFVEQLFAYPEDDRTWRSLSELLRDREHNLLYGHLGQAEEERLELVPDCADLPYFLRAYFAWKLRLPFAFRRCTRGRAGAPPTCGPPITTAIAHNARDDVEAFREFVERYLRAGVHSGSGRTAPGDDATDLYPVALTREALRPGTVFADPYGHLLVVSAWRPQGPASPGVLFAADAQPDGTIGRRTFWRGTFLFTPDTTDVGAGFKAWRPVIYDRRADRWFVSTNEELRTGRAAADRPPVPQGIAAWSDEQYRGSTEEFYERMEALINPRPLDPEAAQVALVDALEESVHRRVVSIENGEEWFRAHPGAVIPMPEGTDIFLTEGPWEDYSTPSRDMRLLVAIDTVVGFGEAMRRRPERWGLAPGPALEAAIARVEQRMRTELASRRFAYVRSDGARQELTLAELIARARAIEIAWNPNDCVEVRWGAPEDSEEMRSCRRRAPPEQRARMMRMRAWFAERRRPTRG